MIDPDSLSSARDRLLSFAVAHFSADARVAGLFLGGSLAAGSADAWSDIDLRVVVTPESHTAFVDQRCEIPSRWPGFVFNEWVPGAQHCVSHFAPFGKVDIFYYDAAHLNPSPWYRLPIRVLHDPGGLVADLLARSRDLPFIVSERQVDYSISKGIAAVHEAYRRARRGELFYAQALLDELRQHVMQADDWLNARTPETTVMAKFDRRGSAEVRVALGASYAPCDADAILTAVRSLVPLYRDQVVALHRQFTLSRPLENDLAALNVVG